MDNVKLETTCNRPVIRSDISYRLTPAEIETMVKLRMTNRAYFSGKKNECMRGWRAILKHMGLNTKLNYYQAAKKWDNMRMKYKELKYSPEGVPHVWWGFKLMDNAMHGLLDNSAPIIALPPSNGDDDADFLPYKRKREHNPAPSPQLSLGGAGAPEIEVSLLNSAEEEEEEEEGGGGDEATPKSREALRFAMRDVESERLAMESERASLEGERALMERDRQLVAMETLVLQRERAGLEREEAALGRHRAALQRERTAIEREKVLMERERTMLERERTELSRERLAMERGRGRFARESAMNGGMNGDTHENGHGGGVEADGESGENGGGMDPERLQRRERFLDLLEKLVENF